MKIIIAPSKTMKYKDYGFTQSPQIFNNENKYLYSLLKEYNDEQLGELMNISYKQSTLVYNYFHQEQVTYPALSLYQGTVFKQLDFNHYHSHLEYIDQHLRIMSAYYGVLKYNTGITPYRLDMTMKPHNLNLYDYWYTPIYQYFEDEDMIISLASKEFSQMIHHPHMYFIDFMEIKDDKIKRNSMIIKKARGMMLNQMILNEVKTLDHLKQLSIDGFIYNEELSHEMTLAFVRKEEK